MEISLTPEMEERPTRLASQVGKEKEEVVRNLVASYLEHDAWFRQEVTKGLASLDRGETISHEEVGRRMERRLGSQ